MNAVDREGRHKNVTITSWSDPSYVDGIVARLIELSDGTREIEEWVDGRWQPSKVDMQSMAFSPPAKSEIMAKLDIPPEERVSNPLPSDTE